MPDAGSPSSTIESPATETRTARSRAANDTARGRQHTRCTG